MRISSPYDAVRTNTTYQQISTRYFCSISVNIEVRTSSDRNDFTVKICNNSIYIIINYVYHLILQMTIFLSIERLR